MQFIWYAISLLSFLLAASVWILLVYSAKKFENAIVTDHAVFVSEEKSVNEIT